MSSKRKREKEGSAKQKVKKKQRTSATTRAAEGAEEASIVDETGLNTTIERRSDVMDNTYDGASELPSNQLTHQWSVREPVGGRLLDLPPVFSADGRHYLLAYTSGVKVFSCETSLQIQFLPRSVDATIIAFSISPSDSSSLIIGLGNGLIERWTWMKGVRTASFDIDSPICALSVASFSNSSPPEDFVFVSYQAKDEWCVAAYSFGDEHRSEEDDNSMALLTNQNCISTIQSYEHGNILIASDGHRISVGMRQNAQSTSLKTVQYHWREFTCTGTISTMKARISTSGTSKHPAVLDLAVGTREGMIYMYRDVINQTTLAKKSRQLPPVVRFHWHRTAVATVDWSLDGNYLISGGEETVLVLWQLNSNQKSFLPHLSASILHAVVSPSGESYGVTLVDNSSMVLRALTLEPETSIAEPQLFLRDATSVPPRLASAAPKGLAAAPRMWRTPISAAKSSPRLLFCTFTSDTNTAGTQNSASPFLHTFDYKSGGQISKQALARTFTTDRKVGPKGEKLNEPRIVLVQVSADEKWLATVDEWTPRPDEMNGTGPFAAHSRNAQPVPIESNLRFWSWKDSKKTWEMVWRTSLSHNSQSLDPGSGKAVLDIAADPQDTKFYTLSEDLTLRVWYPTQRLRSGMRVKDEENNEVSNWTYRQIGALPVPPNKTGAAPSSGKISVSPDGSLLLVGVSTKDGGVVGTIDARTFTVLSAHFDRTSGPIRGLGIAGSCAVALSDTFAAWDLVETSRVHKAELGNPGAKPDAGRPYFHLACDAERETLAVVSPTVDEQSLVTILHGSSLIPEAVVTLPSLVVALLPAPSQRGFIAINTDSEITLITSSSIVQLPQSQGEQQHVASRRVGLNQVFGDIAMHPSSRRTAQPEEGRANVGAIVPASKSTFDPAGVSGDVDPLHRIFESSQPMSSPAVMDMFRQVAAVLSKSAKVSN